MGVVEGEWINATEEDIDPYKINFTTYPRNTGPQIPKITNEPVDF